MVLNNVVTRQRGYKDCMFMCKGAAGKAGGAGHNQVVMPCLPQQVSDTAGPDKHSEHASKDQERDREASRGAMNSEVPRQP